MYRKFLAFTQKRYHIPVKTAGGRAENIREIIAIFGRLPAALPDISSSSLNNKSRTRKRRNDETNYHSEGTSDEYSDGIPEVIPNSISLYPASPISLIDPPPSPISVPLPDSNYENIQQANSPSYTRPRDSHLPEPEFYFDDILSRNSASSPDGSQSEVVVCPSESEEVHQGLSTAVSTDLPLSYGIQTHEFVISCSSEDQLQRQQDYFQKSLFSNSRYL